MALLSGRFGGRSAAECFSSPVSPKIHPSFWSDKLVESLPPESKLSLLWLITNHQTNILGVCDASEKRFHFDTGLPPEALKRAIQALQSSLFHKGGIVFLRHYIRHQFGTGSKLTENNIFKSMSSVYSGIKDQDIRKAILDEYPEFKQIEEGLTKGLPRALQAQREREGEGERKGERERGGVGEILPETLSTPEFVSAWEKWKVARRAMKKCKDFDALFRHQIEWLAKMPVETAIASLTQSTIGGYQGLFEVKNGNPNNSQSGSGRLTVAQQRNAHILGSDEVRKRLERDNNSDNLPFLADEKPGI